MGAGLADAEKALLETHLAGTATGWASLGLSPRLGAAAGATVAAPGIRHFDLLFHAEGRLFETDLHVVEEVIAPLAATAGPAAEHIAEDVAEDVAERAACAETEAPR